jgi:hypothetical protein
MVLPVGGVLEVVNGKSWFTNIYKSDIDLLLNTIFLCTGLHL